MGASRALAPHPSSADPRTLPSPTGHLGRLPVAHLSDLGALCAGLAQRLTAGSRVTCVVVGHARTPPAPADQQTDTSCLLLSRKASLLAQARSGKLAASGDAKVRRGNGGGQEGRTEPAASC